MCGIVGFNGKLQAAPILLDIGITDDEMKSLKNKLVQNG